MGRTRAIVCVSLVLRKRCYSKAMAGSRCVKSEQKKQEKCAICNEVFIDQQKLWGNNDSSIATAKRRL
jgi:hypothetical protein